MSLARAPFATPLAEELAPDVLGRFLRYVRIDTQAAHRVPARPSTAKQLDLSRLLVEELREAGLDDAHLNEGHSVFATLPSTVDASKIAAEYKHGVLTVTLPFREEAKPRTINVEVAA